MTRSRLLAALLAVTVAGTAAVGTVYAAGHEIAGKMPGKKELLFQVARRLVAKGDHAVLAVARLAKARLYLEKLEQPARALEELEKLEQETDDPEIRVVVTFLKVVVMEKAQVEPAEQLAALDATIAAARERLN